MYLFRTPNFQRQHYLYWCNVYNLSLGKTVAPPFEFDYKGKKKNLKYSANKKNFFGDERMIVEIL